MELRHLRYFVTVAEELHFTRAARRIGIAQPPLTQQIKALEEELGVRLFDRAPGKVTLTAAGRVFFEESRAILESVDKAINRTRLYAQGFAGRICVGFTESASFSPAVTASLHRFRESYPDVELRLEENRSTQLVDALRHGRIDAAFVRLPIDAGDDIQFDLISNEQMVLAVNRQHQLASRKSVPLSSLVDEQFILYPRATRLGLTESIILACQKCGFNPNVVQHAPQISSTINLVASSLGVTIVPKCMSTSRPDAVRYLSLKGADLRASLGIAYRIGDSSSTLKNLLAISSENAKRKRLGPTVSPC
ncbi:LysR substrate-binding domain-containing protein [uncultured Caballeronia sp.]|uniref:LysR family transcriptional regulator n=1 Tax=uncultured Caballeronia sp. TaxID=1827198 RepID=UPI0015775DB7